MQHIQVKQYKEMSSEMLSFVLSNVPDEWEKISNYSESYKLFNLEPDSEEYKKVTNLFEFTQLNTRINCIERVQNPFQYGRFKLRQKMRGITSMETVFHIIHADDLNIALKHTCDYRRYKYDNLQNYDRKQPRFYTIDEMSRKSSLTEMTKVLVLSKISGLTMTQSDYYIQYVVNIKI